MGKASKVINLENRLVSKWYQVYENKLIEQTITYLNTKQQESKLYKSKVDDEKHHRKSR